MSHSSQVSSSSSRLERANMRRQALEDVRPRKRSSSAASTSWDKQRTRELFVAYKEHKSLDAREELVVNHLNLARFLASKFKNRGENMDDLIQVATLGLIKAIDRFDIERGLEFTTFATPTILGEIKRHFRDKGWSVRVPRRLQELSAKVTQTTDKLTEKLQRSPSVEDIARELEVSVDEVLEAMESSRAYSPVSLDTPQTDTEDASANPSVLDKYATIDEELEGSDDRIVLTEAIKDFSEREQDIIRMRFLEGKTQVEIAQALDISQVQVSRLLRHTLQKIQEKLEGHFIEDSSKVTQKLELRRSFRASS